MNTDLSLATVTAILKDILAESTGVTVQVGPPEKKRSASEIFLYLYLLQPNAELRNQDLPSATEGGHRRGRPRTYLDAYYLISFFGNDRDYATERMVASAVAGLADGAILNREQIRRTLRQHPTELKGSHLTQQRPPVRVTPVTLNADEMSKIWSVFFQTTHRVSLVYLASPIEIRTGDGELPPDPTRVGLGLKWGER